MFHYKLSNNQKYTLNGNVMPIPNVRPAGGGVGRTRYNAGFAKRYEECRREFYR